MFVLKSSKKKKTHNPSSKSRHHSFVFFLSSYATPNQQSTEKMQCIVNAIQHLSAGTFNNAATRDANQTIKPADDDMKFVKEHLAPPSTSSSSSSGWTVRRYKGVPSAPPPSPAQPPHSTLGVLAALTLDITEIQPQPPSPPMIRCQVTDLYAHSMPIEAHLRPDVHATFHHQSPSVETTPVFNHFVRSWADEDALCRSRNMRLMGILSCLPSGRVTYQGAVHFRVLAEYASINELLFVGEAKNSESWKRGHTITRVIDASHEKWSELMQKNVTYVGWGCVAKMYSNENLVPCDV